MNKEKHDPTAECSGVHCYVHNVDEPDSKWVCGECYHAWPSAEALIADDNAKYEEMFGRPGATYRVEDVTVCPFCSHDL